MIEKYRHINSRYKKKLIYNFGSEAGFFSEYNNMILAMLYCLKNNIRFELFSLNNLFAENDSWLEFFEPFCDFNKDINNRKYNYRQPIYLKTITFKIKKLIFKIKSRSYLTNELWKYFHNSLFVNEYFNIPCLNIYGTTRFAARELINLTWRFNVETKTEIKNIINTLNLPNKFAGLHIRSGDKNIEIENFEIDQYINLLKSKTTLKEVFVFTDNFLVFVELKNRYPDYSFFTLCDKNEFGYKQVDFVELSNYKKRMKMLNMFSSVEILCNSEIFIGTYSSNPGMYLGMRMDKNKTHGVDFDQWLIW